MYDTLIIGSGPAGLTAAIYASRAGLRFAVAEKEYLGTGQIAFAERVDNFPTQYGIEGFELGEKMRSHAEQLGTEFIDGEVTALTDTENGWSITLADGSSLESRTVICALGASPRRLGIEGESELVGRGVSFCALCDGAFFEGKTVAVTGGGDTALSDALYLAKSCEKVYLIHRRSEFRANRTLADRVRKTDNIKLVLNAIPLEIQGSDKVTGVRFMQNGEERTIAADGVFVAVGTVPETSILSGIAELDERGFVKAGEDCVTTARGILAAGDIRTKQVRQVITACADGANAVYSVERYLNGCL